MASLKWTTFVLLVVLYCVGNGESAGKIHRAMSPSSSRAKSKHATEFINSNVSDYRPWLYAIPATAIVGLTGIFPLLVIPVEAGHKLREGVSADRLKLLLSFAVGGLLGDVFLHLLPEAYGPIDQEHADEAYRKIGLWIVAGILTFLVLEKIFQEDSKKDEDTQNEKIQEKIMANGHHTEKNGTACNGHTANGSSQNGHAVKNGSVNNGSIDLRKRTQSPKAESEHKNHDCKTVENSETDDGTIEEVKVVGYLNLLANCIDNFTHGLAISGSFLVSQKVGLLTTFAILLHEIPHEIGDFAILLKSGFRRWDAACGQILTATGGLFGAIFGLVCSEAGDTTYWVLPFTSGGFIYIALVTIVPELLEENRPWESFKQVVCLICGIAAMGLVSLIH